MSKFFCTTMVLTLRSMSLLLLFVFALSQGDEYSSEPNQVFPTIRIVRPSCAAVPGYCSLHLDNEIEVEVTGISLGEETGSVVVVSGGSMKARGSIFYKNIITLREIIGDVNDAWPWALGLQFAAAYPDGEMYMTPASVDHIMVWLHGSVDTPSVINPGDLNTMYYNLNMSEVEDAQAKHDRKEFDHIPASTPRVHSARFAYPASEPTVAGFELIPSNALQVCWELHIPADYVYMSVAVNPTEVELKYAQALYSLRGGKDGHMEMFPTSCFWMDIPAYKSHIVEGLNSFHLWVGGHIDRVDQHINVTFWKVSNNEQSAMMAFASRQFAERTNTIPLADGRPAPEPSALRSGGGGSALVITELPGKQGHQSTGDEHAIGVVVDAVVSLNMPYVIASRICGWADKDKGVTALQKMQSSPDIPEAIKKNIACPLNPDGVLDFLRANPGPFSLIVVMSRVWDEPIARGLPATWLPTLRLMYPTAVVVVWGVDLHARCNDWEHYLRAGRKSAIRMTSQLGSLGLSDAVIAYTMEDIEAMRDRLPERIRLIHSPTNHATVVQYPANEGGRPPGFEGRSGVILFGCSHIINVETNMWFITHVWPKARKLLQEMSRSDIARVRVVGMTHKQAIKYTQTLGFRDDDLVANDITWEGYVEDLGEAFDDALVCATPVLSCPEFASKTMRPLERGVPVITTDKGAYGYVEDGMSAPESTGITVAPLDGAEFAKKLVELMTQEDVWSRSSAGGRRHMAINYNREKVLGSVRKVFEDFGFGQPHSLSDADREEEPSGTVGTSQSAGVVSGSDTQREHTVKDSAQRIFMSAPMTANTMPSDDDNYAAQFAELDAMERAMDFALNTGGGHAALDDAFAQAEEYVDADVLVDGTATAFHSQG